MKKALLFRVTNRVLHLMARNIPGARTVRPFLHRLRGVKIEKDVWIGDDVYIENEYPEMVEIHENAGIQLRVTLLAHTRGSGKIIIGKDVFVGCGSIIFCPPNYILTIGEGSVIAANSLISKSIPPFSFVAAPEAKPIARVTVPFFGHVSYQEFIAGLRPIKRNNENNVDK
jgi:acetyltransferase-like isoleucine patch superfamily enzyme